MEQNNLIIDGFCGGGGASVGIQMATGREVDIAVNHDFAAILMHKTNHPHTKHLTEDIFKVDLKRYVKGRHVALMWMSPDCTHFSKAKGGQPLKQEIRMLPMAVVQHAKSVEPDVVIIENVEEIRTWGKLNKHGKPIPSKKGKDWHRFLKKMYLAGYHKQAIWVLNSADYGAPTARVRLYGVFRRDGKDIIFPKQTHSKDGLVPGTKPWLQCGDYIDWSDLGQSIFDRKKPLAEATQRRIANGIRKFILENPNPYIVKDKQAVAYMIQYHGETKKGDSRGQLLTEPIKTIDTSNRYGLVTAFLTKFYKTGTGSEMTNPLPTVTTSPGHFGIVSAYITKYYGQGVGEDCREPLHTITAGGSRFAAVSALLIKYYGTGENAESLGMPLQTITTKDRFGLVSAVVSIDGEKYVITDIFLRMLKPEELKVMQGFPKDYIIDRDYFWKPYPKSEQVARIGNSVVPIMAQKIVEANCPYLKVGVRQPNPVTYWQSDGQMAFA